MSQHPKTVAKSKTAEQIRNQFNEACFQLGQEIRNEERAMENQTKLKDLLGELEAQFNARAEYEREVQAKQAKASEQTKDFEAKVEASTVTSSEAPQSENSPQS